MRITKDGLTVLHHGKDNSDHLRNVQLVAPTDATAASAILCSDTDAAFATFIHTALGIPVLPTLLRAVRKGYLASYPRRTANSVTSYLSLTAATARGHLDQHRQGLDSTSMDDPSDDPEEVDHPPLPRGTVFTKTISLPQSAHLDLTGRFPIKALSGSEYVFISVLDGYTHFEPIASRHQSNYIDAYKNTINFWDKVGHKPLFQRLDNETSAALETYAAKNNFLVQYCPPCQHRSLKAEGAIRTFKNHFISKLCTFAIDFPLTLWDTLLTQAELFLNHLLSHRPNPNILSAYEGLHRRQFDFRAHPIAPAGTKVIIHSKPTARGTWAPHGVLGFYLGLVQQHYHYFSVWAIETQSIRVTDTLAWILDKSQLPNVGLHDIALAATKDLAAAIMTIAASHPGTARLRQLNDPSHTMLADLKALLQSFSPQTASPTVPGEGTDEIPTDTSLCPPTASTAVQFGDAAVTATVTGMATTYELVPATDTIPTDILRSPLIQPPHIAHTTSEQRVHSEDTSPPPPLPQIVLTRSEERRVGKECW